MSSSLQVHDTERAAATLISAGREAFHPLFPGRGQRFDDLAWDVGHLRTRSHQTSNRYLHFTPLDRTDEPLPAAYADVIRSWIVLNRHSPSNMQMKLSAARMLWEVVQDLSDGLDFRWESLSDEHLRRAEQRMRERWADNTAYATAGQLHALAEFLAQWQLCRPLTYRCTLPRPSDLSRYTLAGQDAARAKLPTETALKGIAQVYFEYAAHPADRLLAGIIALQLVGAFRIGEVLTLPVDCEVEEERGGKRRYGLRYWVEKRRGGTCTESVKWLTPLQEELARDALLTVRALTQPARDRARVLEANPTRVPLPGAEPTQRISTQRAAEILGFPNRSALMDSPGASSLVQPRDSTFLVADLEAYLLQKRVPRLWSVDFRDGRVQPFSETLCVTFLNFFHSTHVTSPLLVNPITDQHIADFLASRTSSRGRSWSVFERFDIREPDGSVCRLTSHQLRHYVNDIADQGGLPLDLLTLWAGRKYARDTEAYRHATRAQRVSWVKRGIRDGALDGTIAQAYHTLPEQLRDDFLNGQLHQVHFTAVGLCVHDYSIAPCPYHLNCLRGCRDHLWVKGDTVHRANLVQIRSNTSAALQVARTIHPSAAPAAAWIRSHEELLEGIDRTLQLEEDTEIPEGQVLRTAPAAATRFQPLDG